ncbi:MAG: di-heme oxidoredictase family protein [Planctomycetota bacterium]|nr:di-heme oxidoredictase family protein [Planctomycetota bacterium]
MSLSKPPRSISSLALALLASTGLATAQQTDQTQTPNVAGAGIVKSLAQEIGAGRGDVMTPLSSKFILERDPFRSIQRGRQLFQRKFTAAQGLGPRMNDGIGNIEIEGAFGAGLADSCGACHSRPFGSAGVGGNVFTRPESRDAPHLFGLGLQEMLADEITRELRAIRTQAATQAQSSASVVTLPLVSKSIHYGTITALANGTIDTSGVDGVNPDLRVRPFFAQGKTISMREFIVGAFNAEMGLQAVDPDTAAAAQGQDVVTPSGMLLSGSTDTFEAPPTTNPTLDPDLDGVVNEIPTSLVDSMEFYLLNYFKPGRGRESLDTEDGERAFRFIGCTTCHVQDLTIDHDRRVADVEVKFDAVRSNRVFNGFFATAIPLFSVTNDGSGLPTLKRPAANSFKVERIFTDFKRHDLGPGFHERNFDGTITTKFMTEPLWGVGTTAPYGHDGRSLTLEDAILRHGGEAQASRDRFANLNALRKGQLIAFLNSLVLFSPPDTASNLEPVNDAAPNFPLNGHGSIKLSVLFNDPNDKE